MPLMDRGGTPLTGTAPTFMEALVAFKAAFLDWRRQLPSGKESEPARSGGCERLTKEEALQACQSAYRSGRSPMNWDIDDIIAAIGDVPPLRMALLAMRRRSGRMGVASPKGKVEENVSARSPLYCRPCDGSSSMALHASSMNSGTHRSHRGPENDTLPNQRHRGMSRKRPAVADGVPSRARGRHTYSSSVPR